MVAPETKFSTQIAVKTDIARHEVEFQLLHAIWVHNCGVSATDAGSSRLQEFYAFMRGKLLIFFLGLLIVSGYVAAPFVTAWSIREAIRTGDAPYLEAKVDWPSVKQSLKASMGDYAFGTIATGAPQSLNTATVEPQPGLWHRLKHSYGRRMLGSMIDNMVTPVGLARLFSYRQGYNEKVRGIPDEREAYPLMERMQRSWQRVVRAEFLTPTRFAMEMRDRVIENRIYAGVLELRGLAWQLVHLEVKRDPTVVASAADTAAATNSGVWSKLREAALPSGR